MGKKRRSGKRKLSILEDYDQDGVPNFDDCQPLDPTQHGMTDAQRRKLAQRKLYHPVHHRLVTTGGKYTYHVPTKPSTKRKVVSPRPAATRIIHTRIEKPKKVTSVPKLHVRKLSIVEMGIDVVQDIGRDITTRLGQLGTDIQRQAPKEQRPLQDSMLFGSFIGKGERVGRLAVAPTPQRVGMPRVDVSHVTEAKRIQMPSIVTAPVSMLKKGVVVATTPFGLAPAVSGIHKKLTSMYEGIAPPPEQRLYEQQFRRMETGVTAFETKWQPYVKEEQFAGSEAQYKQMLKEHTALEAQLPDFERMQQQMSGLQYKKAERKLADYKTGWIYTGTEKFLETMYPPYIRKAQEAVSSWQRDIGYKPSEHPWLKKIEHAQWYTAKELPGMVLRGGAMLPPALEAAIHKPQEREKMQAAMVPGLAFMGKGMIEEAQREPLGFMETLGITMLAPKAAARVSPIKPMYMKVPTGKSLMKTYTTIGKGVPYEFKALKEVAGPFSAIELGKIAPTKMPGVYKQTHLIPEMATYRGLRLDLPSTIPYHGKTPLVGVVTKPPGIDITRMKLGMGAPEFEMPAQFRVFTGPEARLLMPSMKKMLKGEELAAWEAAFYLQETFGRKRPIIQKPLKLGELEHLKETFAGTEALQELTRYMQKHHRQIAVYGSGAKQAQMARGELITPKDIDIEIRSLASHLSGLTTEMKVPFRARLTPFEVEMGHRISRRMPGLTPEQVAADMAAIAKKHLGGEDIQVSFKPAWQMFSVEKTLKTMQKTAFGLEPEVMGIADIHPPSGLFEFGLKPQRGIKVPVISGLPGEKMPLFPKRVKLTTLGEEFERSFGSVIQMYERRGGVVLSPKPKRVKDIGRFVQTGKMLVETEQLRAELGSVLLRKGRLQKVAKGREALAIWEERALKVPELKEIMPSITAEAILPEMVPILKQQMRETSFLVSERAALGYSEKLMGRKLLPEMDVPIVKPTRALEVSSKARIGWDVTEFFGKEPLKKKPDYWMGQTKKYHGFDVDVRLDPKILDRLNKLYHEDLVGVCSGHTHPTEFGLGIENIPDIGFFHPRAIRLGKRIEAFRDKPGMRITAGEGMVYIRGTRAATPKWWERTTRMLEDIGTKRGRKGEVAPATEPWEMVSGMGLISKRLMQPMEIRTILKRQPRVKAVPQDIMPRLDIVSTTMPDVTPLKPIDTSAYYPKMAKHVPSDYYPKMVTPMVPSDYYPKITPTIDSSYYPQKMPTVAGYDYYPKPAPRVGDYDYYGAPTRKHISQRGAFTPFIGAFMPSFGVGVPKMVGMPKIVGIPKYTPYVPHVPVVTPTATWAPPPTGFTPTPIYTPGYVPPPGHVPPQIPPTPSYVPPYVPPPPTPSYVPPPPTTIWTPSPPITTITRIFPLLPPKKKTRIRKKKYRFEEYPWREKHYIPTLKELMRVPESMTIAPQKAFVMKMPKMPKGLL